MLALPIVDTSRPKIVRGGRGGGGGSSADAPLDAPLPTPEAEEDAPSAMPEAAGDVPLPMPEAEDVPLPTPEADEDAALDGIVLRSMEDTTSRYSAACVLSVELVEVRDSMSP